MAVVWKFIPEQPQPTRQLSDAESAVWSIRDVPEGTTFVSAGWQDGRIVVWGTVLDPDAPRRDRAVQVVGTWHFFQHGFTDNPAMRFLGTFAVNDLVIIHVFSDFLAKPWEPKDATGMVPDQRDGSRATGG